jgi:hypothetical protein
MSRPSSRWSGWQILEVVLAVVAAACGLAVLALVVVLAASLSNVGSNK